MTQAEALEGLQAGKVLRVDRKDNPLLPWLTSDPRIEGQLVQTADEQYSYLRFWWKGATK